ncbi:DUF262 domain-containing protein [Methylobacterium sp. D53M]
MKRISGAEYPLSKIFSSEFDFVIPSYQRPYAWTNDQTSELLDDLLSFADIDGEEGYFLGSIVLIKTEGIANSEVIDGQQRLTTLTILLAAAACAHGGENKEDTKPYIIEPGKKMEGIPSKPRLSLRERDQKFFAKYIQGFAISRLSELDPKSLENESQLNIQANANYLLTELERRLPSAAEVTSFVNFLLTRCFIVAVSTPSQASAFRVFSVMNSRGLDLQPTDIIKADVIGKIKSETDRSTYNAKWEDMEVELTRSGFNELFSHIRMIYVKEKAKGTILEDFKRIVLPKNADPKKFIDEIVQPFAEALMDIKNSNFASSKHAEEINYSLKWLNRIDNADWVPPAMLFMTKARHKPAVLVHFFPMLERLAAFMHAARYNVNDRIVVYGKLISEIESSIAIEALGSLHFDRALIRDFRAALNGNVYQLTPRRRNFIILRLDSFVSDGAASYDPKVLTIEHVLPQNVDEDSQWLEWWPDEDQRNQWVHRLANLVPLNKKRNSAASNFDFKKKCNAYFKGTSNVSSYALTSQVIGMDDWGPKELRARQKELVDIMMLGWGLA